MAYVVALNLEDIVTEVDEPWECFGLIVVQLFERHLCLVHVLNAFELATHAKVLVRNEIALVVSQLDPTVRVLKVDRLPIGFNVL